MVFSAALIPEVMSGRKRQTRRLAGVRPDKPRWNEGDHLWVKESWRTGHKLDGYNATQIREHANQAGYEVPPYCPLRYEADEIAAPWGDNDSEDFGHWGRLRTGRFMPKWVSRTKLAVQAVELQRLQQISDVDIIAEGIAGRRRFIETWDRLHGKRAAYAPWGSNPWVWVIRFRLAQDGP